MENKKINVAEIKQKSREGDAKAQAILGVLYFRGEGVPQNFKKSYIWSSLAAAQGIAEAVKNRQTASVRLTVAVRSRAQDEAVELMEAIEAKQAQ